jgi:hypothetical protein
MEIILDFLNAEGWEASAEGRGVIEEDEELSCCILQFIKI